MRTAISVASMLACAVSIHGQITATINRLPNGVDELRIRNNSAASLVTFVVMVNQAPRQGTHSNPAIVVYSDPLIDPSQRPLLTGEERTVLAMGGPKPVVMGRGLLQEPIVTAGILSDGATSGDPALLARLVLRRSNMLLAVEMSLETLIDAGRRNVPRSQLIEQFKKMVGSVHRWYLPPEQQVGRDLYQSFIGKLMGLPEQQIGSPFPPATFVERETAILNRLRVTLLESEPGLAKAVVTGR